MQITTAEFMASVRETYEEMQQLHKEIHGDNVSYPDFEAAMTFVEQHGLPDALTLEKQYAERLGEMTRLSDLTCGWILKMMGEQPTVLAGIPPEVVDAAQEIMDYVDAVRP